MNGSPELVCHPRNAYPGLVTSGMLAIVLPDSARMDLVVAVSPTKLPLFASNVTV